MTRDPTRTGDFGLRYHAESDANWPTREENLRLLSFQVSQSGARLAFRFLLEIEVWPEFVVM